MYKIASQLSLGHHRLYRIFRTDIRENFETTRTHGVDPTERVAVSNAIAFPRPDWDTSVIQNKEIFQIIGGECKYEKSWLKFAKSMVECVRSTIVVQAEHQGLSNQVINERVSGWAGDSGQWCYEKTAQTSRWRNPAELRSCFGAEEHWISRVEMGFTYIQNQPRLMCRKKSLVSILW